MNKHRIVLSGMSLLIDKLAANPSCGMIIDSDRAYSYPAHDSHQTGHAKINRTAKK
ncbi:hypothetical protein [Providencia manganoxydans]|uniref:hypothetical protein n=1 Tax=Providencia manganoxydans TaxID=2923283 RepID=UPI00293FB6FC|nr:hypothetical protein [Providencia stuartii]ELR5080613.1 hypothetical protein [Providencia stuartii]